MVSASLSLPLFGASDEGAKPESARARYTLIPAATLLELFAAARTGAIPWLAVRLYLVRRERAALAGCLPSHAELEHALGRSLRRGAIRLADAALCAAGLLQSRAGGLEYPDPDPRGLSRFAGLLPPACLLRPVPVFRWIVRVVARSRSYARAAVLIGHAERSCFRDRSGRVRTRGRVSAAWIARAFDLHPRAVTRARSALVDEGLLAPIAERQHAAVRFHGPLFDVPARAEVSGVKRPRCAEVSGVKEYEHHEDPGSGIRAEHAYEHPSDAACAIDPGTEKGGPHEGPPGISDRSGMEYRSARPTTVARSRPSRPERRSMTRRTPRVEPGAPAAAHRAASRPAPGSGASDCRLRIPHLEREDLRQLEALRAVHAAAAAAGRVAAGDGGLLEVATLAQRALRSNKRNAAGLLYRLLDLPPAQRFARAEDEDRARALVRTRIDPPPRGQGLGPLSGALAQVLGDLARARGSGPGSAQDGPGLRGARPVDGAAQRAGERGRDELEVLGVQSLAQLALDAAAHHRQGHVRRGVPDAGGDVANQRVRPEKHHTGDQTSADRRKKARHAGNSSAGPVSARAVGT